MVGKAFERVGELSGLIGQSWEQGPLKTVKPTWEVAPSTPPPICRSAVKCVCTFVAGRQHLGGGQT